MSILPLTVPPKKLAQTISSTATSFKLNNIQGWDADNLTSGDFGTEAFVVFINSTRTQIEIMKIDPATIANSEITILARGLDYLGGEVSDPSRQYAWVSNDTTVQLGTDAPQLFRDFLSGSNTATITALHTYDTLPQSAVTPTNDEDFATKQYVDGLTEPAVTIPINQTAHGFSVGDVIRISGVNTYTLAQADSPANAEVVGIVTEVVDADNFEYITEGVVTTGVPVFAAGTVLFLSRTTPGALVDTDTTTIGEVSFPLAIISESGVRMIFHKYRPAVINSIAGNPIASETIAGTVEEATQAEADSKTVTGGTGAKLFVPASKMRSTKKNDYVADTGAANAYVIAPNPAITAYAEGQEFTFKVANQNTGASTLNVNGVGAVAIKTSVTDDLPAGILQVGQVVTVVYDGTNFQLVGLTASSETISQPVIETMDGTTTPVAVAPVTEGGIVKANANGVTAVQKCLGFMTENLAGFQSGFRLSQGVGASATLNIPAGENMVLFVASARWAQSQSVPSSMEWDGTPMTLVNTWSGWSTYATVRLWKIELGTVVSPFSADVVRVGGNPAGTLAWVYDQTDQVDFDIDVQADTDGGSNPTVSLTNGANTFQTIMVISEGGNSLTVTNSGVVNRGNSGGITGITLWEYAATGNTVVTTSTGGVSTAIIGFIMRKTGSPANNAIVQHQGILDGFTGLTPGAPYYLTNTPGAISTTPGANTIGVGVAVSATELLIKSNL